MSPRVKVSYIPSVLLELRQFLEERLATDIFTQTVAQRFAEFMTQMQEEEGGELGSDMDEYWEIFMQRNHLESDSSASESDSDSSHSESEEENNSAHVDDRGEVDVEEPSVPEDNTAATVDHDDRGEVDAEAATVGHVDDRGEVDVEEPPCKVAKP